MKNKILICVFNHKNQGLNEAIKKEAFNLYNLLIKIPEFKDKIKFISIETDIKQTETVNNIIYIPLLKFNEFIKEVSPILIHLFVPYLINIFNIPVILNYQSVVTLSATNPTENLNEY